MIGHAVLLKTKPGIAVDDPRVTALLAELDTLRDVVPGIAAWRHGRNITLDPQAWDYAVYAEFETEGALQSYYEHPRHGDIVRRWEEIGMLLFADVKL